MESKREKISAFAVSCCRRRCRSKGNQPFRRDKRQRRRKVGSTGKDEDVRSPRGYGGGGSPSARSLHPTADLASVWGEPKTGEGGNLV